MEIMNVLSECNKGNHNLIEVYRGGYGDAETVVRWCKVCGNVVVDIDCDNRTFAGRVMKMKVSDLYYKTVLNNKNK